MTSLILYFILTLPNYTGNIIDSSLDTRLIPDSLLVNAHAVIRYEHTKCDVVSLDKMYITKEKVVTILDKKGVSAGVVSIHYTDNSDKIKDLSIEVYNAKGKRIKEVKEKEINDLSVFDGFSIAGDARRKYYSYTANSFPYTVKYKYIKVSKNTLGVPSWVPLPSTSISVQSNSYKIVSSVQGFSLQHKERNLNKKSMDINREDHIYSAKNLKAIKYESQAPNPREYFPLILFSPTKFTYCDIEGSFNNWQSYGQWIYDNMLKERGKLPQKVVQEIDALIPVGSNKEEIARIVYEYVTESTRYVSIQLGIGGLKPFDPEDVYKLKYGDCKALSFYTANILKHYNIDAIYTEVSHQKKYAESFYEDISGPTQGNHIILCLPNEGDTTWLECTSNSTFFGYAHTGIDNRKALLISPEGGKLITTTKYTSKENLAIKKAKITIDAKKAGYIDFDNTYYNQRHERWASLLRDTEEEQNEKLRNHFFDHLPKYELIDYNIQPHERELKIRETATIKVKNLLEKAGNFLLLPYMVEYVDKPSKLDLDRAQDIYIKNGKSDKVEIDISIPEGYSISEKSKDLDFENTFGKIAVNKVKANDSLYRVSVDIEYNEGTFAPSKVVEYNLFIEKLSKVINDKILFTPK